MDFVPDAPFADFATATAAVVHFGRFEHGQSVERDEVRRKRVGESRSRPMAVRTGPAMLGEGLTMDTSIEQRNVAAGPARYE